MEYFNELGRKIEQRWRRVGSDDLALVDIAMDELTASPAHLHVSCDDILDWCNQPYFEIPYQHDIRANFGDPPVTVYFGSDMVIDVNFWMHSTTVIHEHGFEGAFQVLAGSSLHTRYDWTEGERYNVKTYVGQLEARPAELLSLGDLRPIHAGPSFIHALFHLERPSATVVVRSRGNRLVNIQRNFFPPGFAFDPNTTQTARRNQQIASHMIQCANPRFGEWLLRYLHTATPGECFEMLLETAGWWSREEGMVPELLEDMLATPLACVRERCWSGERVVEAFRREWKRSALVTSRVAVKDPDRRWFLAVLVSIERDGRDIYRLVEERYPGESAREKVFAWVEELCGPESPIGLVLNRSMLRIARGLAEGRSLDQIGDELNAGRKVPASPEVLAGAVAQLRASALAPLLSPPEHPATGASPT